MAGETPRKIPVVFYRTRAGTEVVRDWLRSLDPSDRSAIGLDLMRVQFRWPVGMPLCRAMSDGLWEMRSNLPSNRIARVLFCIMRDRIVVLHGFIKKTQKTPDQELSLARKRKRELEALKGGRNDQT
jgi:phage-related protein